jgi:teichuronic acid biosynthesis glycosyltransferase TuaH
MSPAAALQIMPGRDRLNSATATDSELPATCGDVVFCFSYLSWQAAADRGWFGTEDRLARGLLVHERVERLLVCDLMRSLPAKLLRDCQVRAAGREATFPRSGSARLLRPMRLRRDYPTSIDGVRRACAALDRALEREARRMGLREPAVIVANPLLAGFAEFAWAGPVTFFATDDWLAYEPHRRWWPAYAESFARLRMRGRRVCAVSSAALARIAPTGPSAVVPNGIDPAEWRGASGPPPVWLRGTVGPPRGEGAGSRLDETAGLPRELARPLLLYTGSLDSRLDVPALLQIARQLPEATIVLVGPLLAPDHLAPLRAAPNVEIRPPLERPELIELVRAADLGLLVHRELPLTRAMSPLKLYEYLAAGLPVVATDLPPVRGVHPSVELVQPLGGDYARAVRAALVRGRAAEPERLAFIERSSWRARHDELLSLALA